MLAVSSVVHEPQKMRSCKTRFKPLSHDDKKDTGNSVSETSRPLSENRQKQSSKHKVGQITSETEKKKNANELDTESRLCAIKLPNSANSKLSKSRKLGHQVLLGRLQGQGNIDTIQGSLV